MAKIFINFFRYILEKLCQLSCYVLKEEKSVLIAGHGAKYLTGNNAYLFRYFESAQPDFNYYFYTKNKTVYNELRVKYSEKVLYAYRWKAFIKFIRSGVLIVSTGPDDFFPYPLAKKKKIINIWHGTPIKNIGFLISGADQRPLILFSKAINYFCVSSGFEGEVIKNAFHLSQKKLLLTGQPKNDFIRQNHSEFLKAHSYLNKKVILYAPTFRDVGMKQKTLNELFPLSQLQEILEKYDACFLYRNHINTTEQQIIEDLDRIIPASFAGFPDAQPLLYHTDILITDYSGIYFDFLLLNRPVIFYTYDYATYREKRDFLFPFERNTPGPKVQTPEFLINAIEDYLLDPKKDSARREEIKNKFHTFTDGRACERINKIIMGML